MKIEIKNLKYSAFASEETLCFNATVYVDGRRAFQAESRGTGGCVQFYGLKDQPREVFHKLYTEALAFAEAETGSDFEPLDELINGLVCDELEMKDMRKTLKKSVIFKKKDDEGMYQIKYKDEGHFRYLVKLLPEKYPECVIVNTLPESEQLSAYKGH